MIHLFLLIVSLGTGQPLGIAEGKVAYPTVEACQAAAPDVIQEGNKILADIPNNPAAIAKYRCATEGEMRGGPAPEDS